MAKRKVTKRQTMVTKHCTENERSNHTKTRGELRCSGRVSSLCSTCGTRHVTLVTNPVDEERTGL